MIWTTECVVDILRRAGPGALPTERLKAELRLVRPPILLTRSRLGRLVEESEGRIALLEVTFDDAKRTVLDSWVILVDPRDCPTRPGLAAELWRSLATLARDLDATSRVEVSRWMSQARMAAITCSVVVE